MTSVLPSFLGKDLRFVFFRALGMGWTPDHVRELFRRYGVPELRAHADPRWLDRVLPARAWHVQETRGPFDRQLDGFLSAMATGNPFEGRTRWTDRAVSVAVAELAREAGPFRVRSFALSSRDVVEHAGVHEETAARTLRRLSLPVTQPALNGDSAVYDLRGYLLTSAHSYTALALSDGLGERESRSPVEPVARWHAEAADYARSRALGKAAELVTALPYSGGDRAGDATGRAVGTRKGGNGAADAAPLRCWTCGKGAGADRAAAGDSLDGEEYPGSGGLGSDLQAGGNDRRWRPAARTVQERAESFQEAPGGLQCVAM